MKMRSLSSVILILTLMSGVVSAASLGDANYTTPSNWSQHYSPNGIMKSTHNRDIAGGTFNLSLTERYKLNAGEYANDQAFYQYIRGSYVDIPVGEGTISLNLFMRVAKDFDGNNGQVYGDNRYYFYRDILDIESRANIWAPRFYQGNINFKDIVKGTKLTIGRQYIDHLNSFQIDGGNLELRFLDDTLSFFVYGGLPVSYFVNTLQSYTVGAGVKYKPISDLTLALEYNFSDVLNDQSSIVKLRADWKYAYGSVYAQYGNNYGKSFYELGTVFRWAPSKTMVYFDWEQLLGRFGESLNYFSNPLAYVLTPYGEYLKAKVRVQQGITDFLLVGVGVEYKNAVGTENWDNRDYTRYFGNIDLMGLPFEGTYISLLADYWDISGNQNASNNGELTFGIEITQEITKAADIWLGTSFNRYQYDFFTDRYKDWVRSYYIGAQWKINDWVSTSADLTYEESEVLRRVGGTVMSDFIFQLWVNILL